MGESSRFFHVQAEEKQWVSSTCPLELLCVWFGFNRLIAKNTSYGGYSYNITHVKRLGMFLVVGSWHVGVLVDLFGQEQQEYIHFQEQIQSRRDLKPLHD